MITVQGEYHFITLGSLLPISFDLIDHAEIMVGLRIAGIQSQSLLQLGDRFIVDPELFVNHAKVVMSLSVERPQSNGPFVLRLGLQKFFPLLIKQRQIKVTTRLFGKIGGHRQLRSLSFTPWGA